MRKLQFGEHLAQYVVKILITAGGFCFRKVCFAHRLPIDTVEGRIVVFFVDRIPDLVKGVLPDLRELDSNSGSLRSRNDRERRMRGVALAR